METHAAGPNAEDADRIRQINRGLIKQAISEPSAQYDTQGCPGHEVVDLRGGRDLGRKNHKTPQQAPTENNPRDISERVPADRQRSDLQGDRIDIGKQQNRNHA